MTGQHLGLRAQARRELHCQPGFPDAGFPDNHHQGRLRAPGGAPEGSVQPGQLGLPAQQGGAQPRAQGAGAGDGVERPPGHEGASLPIEASFLDGFDKDGIPEEPPRVLADQHFPFTGRLLQAGSYRDGGARRRGSSDRGIADHYLPGVDPEAGRESDPLLAFGIHA